MKYKDPFLGEIELTKLGETPIRYGMVQHIIYKDDRDFYYIEHVSLSNMMNGKKEIDCLSKELIDKIKEVC